MRSQGTNNLKDSFTTKKCQELNRYFRTNRRSLFPKVQVKNTERDNLSGIQNILSYKHLRRTIRGQERYLDHSIIQQSLTNFDIFFFFVIFLCWTGSVCVCGSDTLINKFFVKRNPLKRYLYLDVKPLSLRSDIIENCFQSLKPKRKGFILFSFRISLKGIRCRKGNQAVLFDLGWFAWGDAAFACIDVHRFCD